MEENTNKLWTVISTEPVGYSSNFVVFKRVEQKENETVKDMLIRENLLNDAVYIFEGHPKLEGE